MLNDNVGFWGRRPKKGPILKRAAATAAPLKRVVDDKQLTSLQETVGQKFFGHAAIRTIFNTS